MTAPVRKLCWWALSCSLGLSLSVLVLPVHWLLPVGAVCLLFWPAARLFQGTNRVRARCCLLGLAVGLFWGWGYLERTYLPAMALAGEEEQSFSLTVADYPVEASFGTSYTAQLKLENGHVVKVRVYTDCNTETYRPGDRITLRGRAARADEMRASTTLQFLARGLRLFIYDTGKETSHLPVSRVPLRFWPVFTAQAVKASLLQAFPEDAAGFLIGLLTGDKSYLPAGVYSDFQRSGLAHVVAVSGLHLGFLTGFFFLLFGRGSRFSLVGSLGLMVFFVLATGSSPSAVRSAWMTGLILLASQVGREEDDATILSVALVLILLADPFAIASVSLQLSFASVAGIYFISKPLNTALVRRIPSKKETVGRRWRRSLAFSLSSSLSVSAGTTVLTAPLVAINFQSLSLLGPVMNLLVLWLIPPLFLGGLATAALGIFFPGVAQLSAGVLTVPIRGLLRVVHLAAGLPYGAISLRSTPLRLWFCFSCLVLVLWFLLRSRVSLLLPPVCITIGLVGAQLAFLYPVNAGRLTAVALDVGQGASTLLYAEGSTALVDCGGNGRYDAGDVAADYLQSLGQDRLDYLILTHCHDDHANGAPQLLSRLPVEHLILPYTEKPSELELEIRTLAQEKGCKVHFLSYDSTIRLGSASLTIFPPLGVGDANEQGLSLLCSVEEFDLLITGDMAAATERALVQRTELPAVEVLLVGHHGSGKSSSLELLAATTPAEAIISVGAGNSYGHPAKETLERLAAVNCHVSRTDELGTITITYQGGP